MLLQALVIEQNQRSRLLENWYTDVNAVSQRLVKVWCCLAVGRRCFHFDTRQQNDKARAKADQRSLSRNCFLH